MITESRKPAKNLQFDRIWRMSLLSSEILHDEERCCSPDMVHLLIRSNQSVGVVAFAPIRENTIARPRMEVSCNDFWESRLRSVIASSSDSPTKALSTITESHTTSISKKRQNPAIPFRECDSTFREVRRKGNLHHVPSPSSIRKNQLAEQSSPITVCD
jgi:hypothetical protein